MPPVTQQPEPEQSVAGESGVVFATTADGLRLPVIDVTHQAFAVPDDPATLAASRDAFVAWDRRNRRAPAFVTRLLVRLAARRSLLLRKILDFGQRISRQHLDLHPQARRGPPAARLRRPDRPQGRGGSPHMALVRLRMQQIAKLHGGGASRAARGRTGCAARLVNIAGGPALDSINTLIVLARTHAPPDPPTDRDPRLRCAAGWPDLRRAGAARTRRARRAARWARGRIPAPPLRLERHRAARAPARRPLGARCHHRRFVGGRLVRIRH